MSRFIIACAQMTSSDVIADNIAQANPLVAQAAAQGATLVALPENAFFMRRESAGPVPDVAMQAHAGVQWAQQAARDHGIWLLIGSIRAVPPEGGQARNRSIVIDPRGRIAAHYDKLHLFDVTLPNGDSYRESAQAAAGERPVLVRTKLATFGLTICYNVRFATLYRELALAGAEILAVPAAFTRPTGAAHWEILLRARAIENACYVIAPAQVGSHPGGRETYGHSLIIDPWGAVLAEGNGDGPQVIAAEIDLAYVRQVRAQLPVLQHHRQWPGCTVVTVEEN